MSLTQLQFGDGEVPQSQIAPPEDGPVKKRMPAMPMRWVMQRKLELLREIRNGKLTVDQACDRYRLSTDELFAWREALERQGPNGLLATRRNRHYSAPPENSVAVKRSA
jgi:transposase-like protein